MKNAWITLHKVINLIEYERGEKHEFRVNANCIAYIEQVTRDDSVGQMHRQTLVTTTDGTTICCRETIDEICAMISSAAGDNDES